MVLCAEQSLHSAIEIFLTKSSFHVGGVVCASWSHERSLWQNQSIMMTSSNGNIFLVTGRLCGEFTGHRWIPHTKASDAELWCFLWSAPWINGWVNNREAGDLGRNHAHYDVIVMILCRQTWSSLLYTGEPVWNDHLYKMIHYLWLIQ